MGLVDQGGNDRGVTVTLIDGGVRGEAVEVAFAFDVVDPDAAGALDDYVEGLVVLVAVLLLKLDEMRRQPFYVLSVIVRSVVL